MSADEPNAATENDNIIAAVGGWKATKLAELRRSILSADPEIVEEIKWRKPSKPEGVATWMLDGNICMADLLKNAVRLTFPKGARVADPTGLFNTRLDSASVRAIDVFEQPEIDYAALRDLIKSAAEVNRAG